MIFAGPGVQPPLSPLTPLKPHMIGQEEGREEGVGPPWSVIC